MGEFVKVARVSDVAPGAVKRVEVEGEPVALFNIEGEFAAIGDTCSHAQASLAEGYVDGEVVECPMHGARFNIRTGKNLTLPALFSVPSFEVKVEGEDIFVARKS